MSMPAEILNQHATLDALLNGIADAAPIPISGICSDSRLLQAGDVFLACQGATSHGLDFLDQAIAANVAAVVWDATTDRAFPGDVPNVRVAGLANQLGTLANRWFDSPTNSISVTGVTGTNGKTTVAFLIQQCFRLLGEKCAYIGTLGNGIDEIVGGGTMTTPACIELHEIFAGFRDHGAKYAAIEVSSHAIEQSRVDGVQFNAAIFTNLSRDHIDYHGGMRAYFEAKARLFLDHDIRHRIVSLDCDAGIELADRCGADVVAVSTNADQVATTSRYISVNAVTAIPDGSKILFNTSWGPAEIHLPMPGSFNVANAAQVLALLLCRDVPIDHACDVLSKVTAPPGRMEKVQHDTQSLPVVYVDYSHTPAGLEAALSALRAHCTGKLWCVFGCGGDRDVGKRVMMGKIAQRLSDFPLVTSDNPRSEAPAKIISDVLTGMDDDSLAIEDRGEAIAYAISNAGTADIILIAGKGHENYQIIGDRTFDFSDLSVARKCLNALIFTGAGDK